MFWKVIVRDGYAFGFLFEHETLLHSNGLGCAPLRSKCPKNLVPILEIEALAGVSLFPDLAAGGRPTDVAASLRAATGLLGE